MAGVATEHPTARRLMAFLRDRCAEGRPPTIREIARGAGCRSTGTARYHLARLADAGLVRRLAGGGSRSVVPTGNNGAKDTAQEGHEG